MQNYEVLKRSIQIYLSKEENKEKGGGGKKKVRKGERRRKKIENRRYRTGCVAKSIAYETATQRVATPLRVPVIISLS